MTQLALFRPPPEVSPASVWAQRWVQGRQRWRHAHHDGSFDPNAYTVEALPERAARAYVVANHYSGSYPAALRRYGLLSAQRLVGVAVLGVPTSAATLTNVFPGSAKLSRPRRPGFGGLVEHLGQEPRLPFGSHLVGDDEPREHGALAVRLQSRAWGRAALSWR